MTPLRHRQKTRPEPPVIRFPCGCVQQGGVFHGSLYCVKAEHLWDKVAVANHNLMQTRKVAESWVYPYSLYAKARNTVRQAIYEYRRAAYDEHFGLDTRPVYRRVKRTLARLPSMTPPQESGRR